MIRLQAHHIVIAGLALISVVLTLQMSRAPDDPRCFQVGDVTILLPDDAKVLSPATPEATRLRARCAPARKAGEVRFRLRPAVRDLPGWVEDQAHVMMSADPDRGQLLWQALASLCPEASDRMQVRREFLSSRHITDHIQMLDLPGRGKCTDLDLRDWPGPTRAVRMECTVEVALTETVTALFRLHSPAGYFGASGATEELPDHTDLVEAIATATEAIRENARLGTGDWTHLPPLAALPICPEDRVPG